MALNDFFQSTTNNFSIQIVYNSVAPDISSDQVWLYVKEKETDSSYIMSQSADVATSGSQGVAIFSLTPTMTNLEPKNYLYELSWSSSLNEERVLISSIVKVKSRIKDV